MTGNSSKRPFLSILTSSHNSSKLLERAYLSIVNNTNSGKVIEWLIVDDGSNDNTEEVVSRFEETENLIIRYFSQRYSGKLTGINSLSKLATGMFTLELDPDEYLSQDAVKTIKENCFILPNIYAFVFQKETPKEKILGDEFEATGQNTTMFDIRNIEETKGEKAYVYNTSIRRKIFYQEELEDIPEVTDTINYELDKYFEVFAFNNPIITIGPEKIKEEKYRESNIHLDYQNNAFTYYYYYKELLTFNLDGINSRKKREIFKKYILFGYITGLPLNITEIGSLWDKVVLITMYLPVRRKAKSDGYRVLEEDYMNDKLDIQNDSNADNFREEINSKDELKEELRDELKKEYSDINMKPRFKTKDDIENTFKSRTQPIKTLDDSKVKQSESSSNKASKKLDELIKKANKNKDKK